MKQIRLAIVCPYDYDRFGGVQEHVRAVAQELTRRGHYVRVLVPETARQDQNDEAVIHIGSATKLNTPMATTTEVAFSAAPSQIDHLFRQEKFDIVHAHEPWVPLLPRQLLSRSTAKNVGTFHAKLPDNFINKSIQRAWLPYGRAVLRHLDAITAVSEAAADFVSKATTKKIRIIPNGIDLARYNPHKTPPYKDFADNKPTILYIGRLEKRKGVDYLLKAYRRLHETMPEVRLLIAGDGPKRRTLKSYVTRYKMDNVHFLGFVSDSDKRRLLKTCDVFCSPALFGESFGIVLLEAMAMGAPIVAGNNPGYSSVLSGLGALGLIDPKNTAEFANRLQLVLQEVKVASLLKDWGLDSVKLYDYRLVCERYEALYRKLLSSHE